jgi:hypothetical protein
MEVGNAALWAKVEVGRQDCLVTRLILLNLNDLHYMRTRLFLASLLFPLRHRHHVWNISRNVLQLPITGIRDHVPRENTIKITLKQINIIHNFTSLL